MKNPLKLAKIIKEGIGHLNELNADVQKMKPELSPEECRRLTGEVFTESFKAMLTAAREHPDWSQDQCIDYVNSHLQDKFGFDLSKVP